MLTRSKYSFKEWLDYRKECIESLPIRNKKREAEILASYRGNELQEELIEYIDHQRAKEGKIPPEELIALLPKLKDEKLAEWLGYLNRQIDGLDFRNEEKEEEIFENYENRMLCWKLQMYIEHQRKHGVTE